MSLSSPQLGQMYNKSSMIDAGLWVLKKWKKSKCLMQMSMTDESKMEATCLYRLSEMPGLCWFKNIVLLGST